MKLKNADGPLKYNSSLMDARKLAADEAPQDHEWLFNAADHDDPYYEFYGDSPSK